MSRFYSSAVFLLCAAAVSGCVPVTIEEIPAISGVVRDASTNAPISGAKIKVRQIKQPENEANAISDTSGHFKTDEVSHRAWIPLAFDVFVPDPQIEVSATGYAKVDDDLYKMGSPRSEIELRLIHSDQDH